MKITKKKQLNIRTERGMFKIELQTWDNEPGYVVRVPKLPEIITQGSSIKEAKKMAREAIDLCLKDEHYTHTKSARSSPSVIAPRF